MINSLQIIPPSEHLATGVQSPQVQLLPDSGTAATPSLSEAPVEAVFPSDVAPPPPDGCSYNECLSGHRWPAQIALAKCPGCTGGIVAIQKTQCPFCNEPIIRTLLRSDFIPRGAGVVGRCVGQQGVGETLDIELKRTNWSEVESTTPTFAENEAKEIAQGL